MLHPHPSWLGRVINAMGEPVDGKGPLLMGQTPYPIRNKPPPAHSRQRVPGKVDLGVRAMNTFLTICRGQRMGIFAGSGVGKSTLLSMMAKHTSANVSVIGLVGERGREAREFIEDDLGPEGLKRSVVDRRHLGRIRPAAPSGGLCHHGGQRNFSATSTRDVLCLMDSVTRFAMAQREISLSVGEPPA